MLYQFKSDDVQPNSIIDRVFTYKGHSYKIKEITKTWGESPILLGYIDSQDENGKISSFLIKCKQSFVDKKWLITVDEKP